MHSSMQRGSTLLGSGMDAGVVRRAHPASGAQWNVQVVRGKVNGRCLWNACKALSLGLLLMVLGAAMATIGYYADHLSMAQEVRGNHTIRVKNESRGFHLNNLSYAGPIVMGVGGFIVVAACVMTFEARDSAAKVVPARFKLNSQAAVASAVPPGAFPAHRTAGSQTALPQLHSHQRSVRHHGTPARPLHDRAALTQAFVRFSRGLASLEAKRRSVSSTGSTKITRSPSAPNLNMHTGSPSEQSSPQLLSRGALKPSPRSSRRTFAACALLNPGLLHRHALSVDETAPHYRYSNESLGHASQEDVGSLAMDLHLPNDCPVTLRVRDRTKPRRPLCRQRPVVMDEEAAIPGPSSQEDNSRRGSHVSHASPRMQHIPGSTSRRSSNASDCTHRSRTRRRDCPHSRGRLERAISSDSRLTGATDLGEAAKGGMEHVKEAVESAVHTAEHGLGNMVEKIEETIGMKKEEAEHITDDMKNAVDGLEAATEDAVAKVSEEISEAETVLASEAEEEKKVLDEVLAAAGDDVKVEDMEDEAMGSAVHVEEPAAEELVAKVPTPAPTPPPETKADPPTLWELEADAILNRPVPATQEPELQPDEESSAEKQEQVQPDLQPEATAEEVVKPEEEEPTAPEEEQQHANNEEKDEKDTEDAESIDPDLLEREEKMRKLHLMMENEYRMQQLLL